MGWLAKLRRRDDERTLDFWERHLDRDASRWQRWAADHGWSYQTQAPELVGRFQPPVTIGAERYLHLLTARLHGVDVMGFERHTHHYDPRAGMAVGGTRSFVVARLPGRPPEQFEALGPERAIRELGGNVPSGHDLSVAGDHLLASDNGRLAPDRLQHTAELLAIQIAAAPTSFWR